MVSVVEGERNRRSRAKFEILQRVAPPLIPHRGVPIRLPPACPGLLDMLAIPRLLAGLHPCFTGWVAT
jgi:hypothetical protein